MSEGFVKKATVTYELSCLYSKVFFMFCISILLLGNSFVSVVASTLYFGHPAFEQLRVSECTHF